jgi:hypothetical protein
MHGGSGGTPGGPGTCTVAQAMIPAPPLAIQILIDGSATMNTVLPSSTATYYNQVQTYLFDPSSGLVASTQAHDPIGATIFQSQGPTCPSLPAVQPALNNILTVNSLVTSHSPNGNTPTAAAITSAQNGFAANLPAGALPVIVVMSAGQPTDCTGAQSPTVTQTAYSAVQTAFGAGIHTFVVSFATLAADQAYFQKLANLGAGSATDVTVYPITATTSTPAALLSDLDAMAHNARSCEIALTNNVDATMGSQAAVTLNGVALVFNTDWVFEGGKKIKLLGDACTNLRAGESTPEVDMTMPCVSVL